MALLDRILAAHAVVLSPAGPHCPGNPAMAPPHRAAATPRLRLEVTPYEEWERKKLNLSHLRTWGCLPKEVVRREMDSIMSNGTWEVIERPYGCKHVGCKWVFKKKLRPDGTIKKYKARLVAKGYTQKEGEDFFDTYSSVARLTMIRVLLTLAASHGLVIHQMDVKTTFLNGELEEEIYMDQPDGYVLEGQEGMVCKLLKSLYSLKQAPKQWHEKFDDTLISAGFVVNEVGKCVYYRYGGGEGVILCLYVDVILIFGTSLIVIEEVKDFLSKSFEMKDLGVTDVILNIKLLRGDEGGITLVQSHYVDKVLSRFGYSDCKIIGSLMYLASATRPDISFAVSKLSRFVLNPGDDHWHALERVMRYLKRTMSYGIHYAGYPKVLEGYSDSNWISDADEIKATSGSKDNMKSSRHVKRRLKYVRKRKNSGVIAFDYTLTAKNLADQFIKGLPHNVIDCASREIGLRPT
uniref:Retrotransposon protein, putative, Ty1-copia subclass n=1 Tax=Oryza sativa subsp. japonica TaxID=39947 RepID=Q2QRM6_ORYSJ|nr:retrotransposon protein, putative, Ty1-copia subclass [Oryza sativa Japonica Group]